MTKRLILIAICALMAPTPAAWASPAQDKPPADAPTAATEAAKAQAAPAAEEIKLPKAGVAKTPPDNVDKKRNNLPVINKSKFDVEKNNDQKVDPKIVEDSWDRIEVKLKNADASLERARNALQGADPNASKVIQAKSERQEQTDDVFSLKSEIGDAKKAIPNTGPLKADASAVANLEVKAATIENKAKALADSVKDMPPPPAATGEKANARSNVSPSKGRVAGLPALWELLAGVVIGALGRDIIGRLPVWRKTKGEAKGASKSRARRIKPLGPIEVEAPVEDVVDPVPSAGPQPSVSDSAPRSLFQQSRENENKAKLASASATVVEQPAIGEPVAYISPPETSEPVTAVSALAPPLPDLVEEDVPETEQDAPVDAAPPPVERRATRPGDLGDEPKDISSQPTGPAPSKAQPRPAAETPKPKRGAAASIKADGPVALVKAPLTPSPVSPPPPPPPPPPPIPSPVVPAPSLETLVEQGMLAVDRVGLDEVERSGLEVAALEASSPQEVVDAFFRKLREIALRRPPFKPLAFASVNGLEAFVRDAHGGEASLIAPLYGDRFLSTEMEIHSDATSGSFSKVVRLVAPGYRTGDKIFKAFIVPN